MSDSIKFPKAPAMRDVILSNRPSQEARRMLALRRSAGKNTLTYPGPDMQEVRELLNVASRVPDHRGLCPWRFIVIHGENRRRLSELMAELHPGGSDSKIQSRKAFLRAPTIVAVISSPKDDGRTPVWEQELSAGAVCYNLLLAANAAGWAGCWLTEWMSFDAACHNILGLAKHERPAGFIYLGTTKINPQERKRPDIDALIEIWEPNKTDQDRV